MSRHLYDLNQNLPDDALLLTANVSRYGTAFGATSASLKRPRRQPNGDGAEFTDRAGRH
ncbi:MAG: hypothetical protein R2854_06070 [Caldilineaceae bacterium]